MRERGTSAGAARSANVASRARFACRAVVAWALVAAFVPDVWAGAPTPVVSAQDAASAAPVAPRVDLARFAELMRAWRGGDDSVLAEWRAVADRCAESESRPELRSLVEFFARLSPDERRRGLALEARFDALRAEVVRSAGMGVDAWRTTRARLFVDLEALVADATDAADPTPGARARSLRAKLRATRIAQDPEMLAAERAEWLDLGQRDAEEALRAFDRASMMPPQLEPLESLAGIELAREHRERASDLYVDLRDLARRVRQSRYEAAALVGLARLAQEAGDLQDSARLLSELARIANPKNDWELAKRQGQFLLSIDEPRRAAEFLATNEPKERSQRTEWHVLMEGALVRAGDTAAARIHVDALTADAADSELAALARADAMLHQDDVPAARVALQVVADPLRLPPRLQADYHRLDGRLRLVQGEAEQAAHAFERALSVGDSIEARLGPSLATSPTASVMGETIGLETVALLAGVRVSQGRALEAAALIEDRQLHALRSAITGGAPAPVTVDVVRAWAQSYEFGLITWVVGADTSVVIHVGRDGSAVGATIPHGRTAIAAAARRLREAAIAKDVERTRELGHEIQSVILPSVITDRIGANPASDLGRVLLCTHGPMEELSFALLPLVSDVSVRRVVPVELPGLLDSARGPATTREELVRWSVLGDPTAGDGMSSLPGAGAEIDEVVASTRATFVRAGERFDRAAMIEALTSGRALHVATHLRTDSLRADTRRTDSPRVDSPRAASAANGAFATVADARFASAAFELSNGERFDVADLRRVAPRLPLAVLSACETGGGQFVDAQASLGVAHAFLESGTRNLIVTSWPVEDRAARAFATHFHAALAKGHSPSRALVIARESLRASGASTADWAAFAIVGRD